MSGLSRLLPDRIERVVRVGTRKLDHLRDGRLRVAMIDPLQCCKVAEVVKVEAIIHPELINRSPAGLCYLEQVSIPEKENVGYKLAEA